VNARFRVDSRGQLTPENAEAQRSLSAMAGSFYLLPTSPDLLCFVRSPSSGGRIAPPRVVLTGDAAGFPLSDLIAFLAQSRWTGVIRVHAPTGERTISMKDGEVRAATSDDPTDRLGEVMVRLGFVDRNKLEEVLRDTPPSKVGRALVERGLLQAHDLFKCLTYQLSEIFHAMVLTHEGTFMLVDQPIDDRTAHTLQLSTQSLLMDAIRKIDEMAHFRKRIPHGRMYVGRKRPSDGKLEDAEARVLAALNGDKTVFELGQAQKMSEFDVTKVVFRLLEGGYAMVSDKPVTGGLTAAVDAAVAPAGRAEERLQKGDPQHVVRVFNLIFREIRDEVAKQGMEREFVTAANAALAGEALSSSPVLQGQQFDPGGVLDEDTLLAGFFRTRDQFGHEAVGSLRKALSDVMFFLLFQAGELLESRADEDLARRVKELLATLEQT